MQPVVNKPPEASMVTKETERQLSKKELKKKGLEELDAVLAELGYTKQETGGPNDPHGILAYCTHAFYSFLILRWMLSLISMQCDIILMLK